ncbi:hypothetical protein CAL7716_013590 [Calothrix sp. PCC 7716]|nr:hypothetical protein CAL7716_013590 [Calothrix sp. PCC 7716]
MNQIYVNCTNIDNFIGFAAPELESWIWILSLRIGLTKLAILVVISFRGIGNTGFGYKSLFTACNYTYTSVSLVKCAEG